MIFAVVLTIVYVIYFSAMITYDLYGKKEVPKESAESFDVSSIVDAEEPISVEESVEEPIQETGFQKEVTEDGVEIYAPQSNDEKTKEETETTEQTTMNSNQLNEVCNQGTEDITPDSSFSCNSELFMNHINDMYMNKVNQRKIGKENVRDNL